MKKLDVPEKDLLYRLYVGEHKSLADVAVYFNTSAMTVRAWLHNYNIKTRQSTTTMYSELREASFSDEQKSLVIGSIFGDGGLRVPKRAKNAHFYEKHAANQRMYLEWKRDLLKPFVPTKLTKEVGGKHTIGGLKCTVQDSYKLVSIAHPYLTALWRCFYDGNRRKTLPNDLDSYLNPFVVAVWVCDDGSLVWNTVRRNYRLDIHTESFSYDDNVRLARCLAKIYTGRIKIYPRHYKSGTKYYLSLRGKQEVHRLCMMLKQFIPSCMYYKFDTYL